MNLTAEELEAKFDADKEDVIQHFDLSRSEGINEKQRRINVDIPEWMIRSLDAQAKHMGISRQALIKVWMHDKLQDATRI